MSQHSSQIGPLARYTMRVSAGHLDADPAQHAVVEHLQALHDRIAERRLARKSSALGWMFARKKKPEPITGLYIWGDVGRGKSMLMDLFFDALPVNRKRRVHFHAFMADVHARIHAHRQDLKAGRTKENDPIPPVAEALADEAWVLCFDEFQVTDIADAMILGRLFERLFARGVVVVATSNVVPDGLYHNGLNRQLFLPFLETFKAQVKTLRLDARTDFRLEKLSAAPTYYAPLGAETTQAVQRAWLVLTGGEAPAARILRNKGRDIPFTTTVGGIARASFSSLCEAPLAAADYLMIAESFHTLVLENVPQMTPADRNAARRFVWLIDALYEMAVKLVVSADGPPDALYPSGDAAFEFQRTVSRLMEMQSVDYLALGHGRPGEVDATDDHARRGA